MNIKVDESRYGNSQAVEKEPSALKKYPEDEPDNHKEHPDNCLLTGSLVMSGGGKALVCAVGENTSLGRMGVDHALVIEGQDTPLKKKLEESCAQISKYCIFITVVIVIAQIFNLMIQIMVTEGKDLLSIPTLMEVVKTFVIAVCVLIVAIPEGMPLAVSLAMALSIDRLKADSILIKNLEAIQVCATLHDVCIGKTGTITQNKMNVKQLLVINHE